MDATRGAPGLTNGARTLSPSPSSEAMSSELRRAEQQTAEAERRNETLSGASVRSALRAQGSSRSGRRWMATN